MLQQERKSKDPPKENLPISSPINLPFPPREIVTFVFESSVV
jgi:hypothetical protein